MTERDVRNAISSTADEISAPIRASVQSNPSPSATLAVGTACGTPFSPRIPLSGWKSPLGLDLTGCPLG